VIFVFPWESMEGTNLMRRQIHTRHEMGGRIFKHVSPKLVLLGHYIDAIVKEFFKVCTIQAPHRCRLDLDSQQ